jgi:hypothetical protein
MVTSASSKAVMISSYVVLNANNHGEFSSLRPQIECYCSVVSIPSSYLGGPRFEFSMESNHTIINVVFLSSSRQIL